MKSHRTQVLFATLVAAWGATLPAAAATRTVEFAYGTKGELLRQTIEPDNAQVRVDTQFTYFTSGDANGDLNKTTVSSPATGNAAIPSRITTYKNYDDAGRATSVTNPAGVETEFVYDRATGGLTQQTDMSNHNVTSVGYDSRGRTIEVSQDDGGVQRKMTEYVTCDATCPLSAKYFIKSTPANRGGTAAGVWTKTYYDDMGRQIAYDQQAFDGTAVIRKDLAYDKLSRLVQYSDPHFLTDAPQWTKITYDALGRTTKIVRPDNSQTTYTYNGLTTTVTNPLGQTTTQIRNALGQLAQVIDPAGNSLYYEYDAEGNLTKTTDAQGNIVQASYDALGRKTQMIDPDLGTWSYEYDVLNQLVKQTNAKGQVTTLAYDTMSRMTQRVEADLTSTWTYDTCINGKQRLCNVTSSNGYQRVYAYNNHGKPTQVSETIDATYTTSFNYDDLSRLETMTYPSGLVVKQEYSTTGYLKAIRNNANNDLFWQVNTLNAKGQMLQQAYGNGIVTNQAYDATTGNLTTITAGANNSVQNLSFTYDALGQMLSRADANQGLNETFLYDQINRLVSNTIVSDSAGLVTQAYAYNSIGNIVAHSEQGSYTYGTKPHAVTQTTAADGSKRQFGYDANGNLVLETQYDQAGIVVAAQGRTYEYTSFDMPKTLSDPANTLAFVYGPEHQRVKQIAPAGTTIYVGSLSYEKEIKTGGVVEQRSFITAGGDVVAVVKKIGTVSQTLYFHRDHQGSVTALTDGTGAVIERMAFEPFGKRRNLSGTTDLGNTLAGINSDRGYTNHEHLDELGLIHMNGRVFNPRIGRFISADPTIPYPTSLQSYNRYSYVRNTPLNATDPSGYSDWADNMGDTDWHLSGDGSTWWACDNDHDVLYSCYAVPAVPKTTYVVPISTPTTTTSPPTSGGSWFGDFIDGLFADPDPLLQGEIHFAETQGTKFIPSAGHVKALNETKAQIKDLIKKCFENGYHMKYCTQANDLAAQNGILKGPYLSSVLKDVSKLVAANTAMLLAMGPGYAASNIKFVKHIGSEFFESATFESINLGEKIFTANGGLSGAIAENVVKRGALLTFENFTIASRAAGDLFRPLRQLLDFGVENGAQAFRFQGTFSDAGLAAKFGMKVGDTFSFVTAANRNAVFNFLKGF